MAEAATAARADGATRNGHRPRPPAKRRAVPGGRAVLGGLLVAAAVVGLFYASTRTQAGPRHSWVVARHALAPGARLAAGDLTTVAIDLPPQVAERAFRNPAHLVGATLVAPLGAGDLVQASVVVAKPSGPLSRELSFAVPRATLGPDLEHGERIDVVATYGSGGDAFTTVVLRQALVVHLDRGRDRVGDQRDAFVTVAVDEPADAVALAHALQQAKLTVIRATGAPSLGAAATPYRQPTPAATAGRS